MADLTDFKRENPLRNEKRVSDKDIRKAVHILRNYFDLLRDKDIRSWKDVDKNVFQEHKKTKFRLATVLNNRNQRELEKFWNIVRDEYCMDHDIDIPSKSY